jgi:hypothetical protein
MHSKIFLYDIFIRVVCVFAPQIVYAVHLRSDTGCIKDAIYK